MASHMIDLLSIFLLLYYILHVLSARLNLEVGVGLGKRLCVYIHVHVML